MEFTLLRETFIVITRSLNHVHNELLRLKSDEKIFFITIYLREQNNVHLP